MVGQHITEASCTVYPDSRAFLAPDDALRGDLDFPGRQRCDEPPPADRITEALAVAAVDLAAAGSRAARKRVQAATGVVGTNKFQELLPHWDSVAKHLLDIMHLNSNVGAPCAPDFMPTRPPLQSLSSVSGISSISRSAARFSFRSPPGLLGACSEVHARDCHWRATEERAAAAVLGS